jgi:hypothetical protein
MHDRFGFFFHVLIHPQLPNPQLPGSQRIRAHGFAVSRFHRRLVQQLFVYAIQDRRTLARC